MQLGMLLHGERGADAALEEAQLADEQGFDSAWIQDHVMGIRGKQVPNEPLDSFTLMTAVGATTRRIRLAWARLNPTFRPPPVLAKMLATLDQITHGRVICTLGAGWFKEECDAYNIHFFDNHEERIGHEREVALLFKELWTHPAPEEVTFEGKYVQVRNLPFSPVPYQRPHPPIWIGGDSESTLDLVKELADGWVMLTSGNPETLSRVLGAPDWPDRPMIVSRTAYVFVADSHDAAVAEGTRVFESGGGGRMPSVEAFLGNAVVGTPDECIARIREIESWGINYIRLNLITLETQERVARQILPGFASDPVLAPAGALR